MRVRAQKELIHLIRNSFVVLN